MLDPAQNEPEQPYLEQLDRGHPFLRFSETLERDFRIWYRRAARPRVLTALSVGILLCLLSYPFNILLSIPKGLATWSNLVTLGGLAPVLVFVLIVGYFDQEMRITPALNFMAVSIAVMVFALLRIRFTREGLHYPYAVDTYMNIFIFLLSGWRLPIAIAVGLSSLAIVIVADLMLRMPIRELFEHGMNLLVSGILAGVAAYVAEHAIRSNFLHSRVRNYRASHDPLTGLLNRRSFDKRMEQVWAQARRDQKLVALMLIDIDYFKCYNDRYGHLQGDLALQSVANVIKQETKRPLDLGGRFGGEEFVIAWYDVSLIAANELAERLRSSVHTLGRQHEGSPFGHITVSAGLAVYSPRGDGGWSEIIQEVDMALYRAKSLGRNRVVTVNCAQAS